MFRGIVGASAGLSTLHQVSLNTWRKFSTLCSATIFQPSGLSALGKLTPPPPHPWSNNAMDEVLRLQYCTGCHAINHYMLLAALPPYYPCCLMSLNPLVHDFKHNLPTKQSEMGAAGAPLACARSRAVPRTATCGIVFRKYGAHYLSARPCRLDFKMCLWLYRLYVTGQ